MRAAHSELEEFALDASVGPNRVLLREPNGRLTERLTVGGLPAARPRSIGGPASANQRPMPSQQRLGAGGRGDAISLPPAWAPDLTLEDAELMTESEHLSLKPDLGLAADQQRVEEEAHDSVEGGERHVEGA